jgi:hypothetical protein
VHIHDPDVVFTDLALAVLGAYLGWRLWIMPERKRLPRAGALILGALASAAFWGAIFHALFPAGTATLSAALAWSPVVLSIVVAAAVMLDLAMGILVPRVSPGIRRYIVMMYAAGFAVVALFVDHSFTGIVFFYVPALLLLLIAAWLQAIRTRSTGWTLIATGLMMSAAAAMLQQARVAIHPVYFDHNAVYHVAQSIAILFLYVGWRRAPASV